MIVAWSWKAYYILIAEVKISWRVEERWMRISANDMPLQYPGQRRYVAEMSLDSNETARLLIYYIGVIFALSHCIGTTEHF